MKTVNQESRKESIKKKIKALLSKTTDNGASKAEMESSLRKANQLMTEYFISENEIKDEMTKDKLLSKSFDMIKSAYDFKLFYHSLALLFDCKVYYNNRKNKITFFGHEQDVDLCGYFYEVIVLSTLRAKKEYLGSQKYNELKDLGYHGKTLTSSFVKGFLVEVSRKMKKMYEDKQSNIKKGTGVILYEKKKKVDDAFENLNLRLRTVKTKISGQTDSFSDGSSKGRNFNLNQGVNGSRKNPIKRLG